MSNIILPLITLVIGAILGFFSTIVAATIQHRRSITVRLLEEFFTVRKELVDAISDLTTIGSHDELSSEQRSKYRNAVSKLFYKHYDFLPRPVLDAMALLEVALINSNAGPFTLKEASIRRMEKSEIVELINKCSLYENDRLFMPLALSTKDSTIRGNQVIKLHARNVLVNLNTYFTTDDLLALTKAFKKGTRVSSSTSSRRST